MTTSPNPTLEELKALGAALPPDLQVAGGEVAGLVGAIAAVLTHGSAIIDAAKQGGSEIYAFLHDEIAKAAETAGLPAPAKGSGITAPTPAPVPQAAAIDYDALAAAMVKAQAAQAAQAAQPATSSATSAQAGPAIAPEPVAPPDTGSGADAPDNSGNVL